MPSPTARDFALQVLLTEADAVRATTAALDADFDKAVDLILNCPASVLTCGVGKAGHIARKLSATLSSTGTPSHFLSPADSVHGDLGSLRTGDLVVLLSTSGESDELLRVLSIVKKLDHPVIAITANKSSSLARHANAVVLLPRTPEACPLGLAPSASTTAMLALSDALALTVMQQRNFTKEQFALYHPAGHLGRKLIKVSEAMSFKRDENLPLAPDHLTVAQVLHEVSRIKRRSGAVILTDRSGQISGLFTDGDLRRILTDNDGSALHRPIADVMTRNPKRIQASALASEAMALMQHHRFDELPVVDPQDHPQGLIDVQDLVVLRMLDVEPEEK